MDGFVENAMSNRKIPEPKMAWLLAAALGLSFLLTGWGSGNSTPPAPAISFSFVTVPLYSLQANATATLIAVVSGDSLNAGVNWSVTCGSAGDRSLTGFVDLQAVETVPFAKTSLRSQLTFWEVWQHGGH